MCVCVCVWGGGGVVLVLLCSTKCPVICPVISWLLYFNCVLDAMTDDSVLCRFLMLR